MKKQEAERDATVEAAQEYARRISQRVDRVAAEYRRANEALKQR